MQNSFSTAMFIHGVFSAKVSEVLTSSWLKDKKFQDYLFEQISCKSEDFETYEDFAKYCSEKYGSVLDFCLQFKDVGYYAETNSLVGLFDLGGDNYQVRIAESGVVTLHEEPFSDVIRHSAQVSKLSSSSVIWVAKEFSNGKSWVSNNWDEDYYYELIDGKLVDKSFND